MKGRLMKKGFALFVSCIMGTALIAGCGSSGTGDSAAADSSAQTTAASEAADGQEGSQAASGTDGTVYNIGICQQLEHPALDKATQGFQDACTELFRGLCNF